MLAPSHHSYLRFYYGVKRQGIDRSEFSYVAPMQPYASYFGLIVSVYNL